MAHLPQDLKPLAHGAGGFALWHYSSDDVWTALLEPGYFATLVQPGDWILYTAADGDGRPATGILLALDQGRCATLLCAELKPPKAEVPPEPGDVIYDDAEAVEPAAPPAKSPAKGRR